MALRGRGRERDTALAVSEKTETLRAFVEAFNRQDFDDAVVYLHPEVEIYPALGGELDINRLYSGRDEALKVFATISEGFKNQVEIEDIVEAGEDKVLLVERWGGPGRQGIETPIEISTVYTFRDDLVVRLEGFRDRAEALEAAGLSE